MDASWVTLAAIWEELGRCGAPTYVLYQLPGFSTILKYGSQEQIDKIFAFRGTGKQMWNSAITEPGAGSDVGSLKTTYTKKDGKFMKEYKCERLYRDARILSIYEGTSQLQVVAAIRGIGNGTYSVDRKSVV